MSNDRNGSRIAHGTRREFARGLVGFAALGLGASVGAQPGGAQGTESARNAATVSDVDGDRVFANRMRLDGGPSDDGRTDAVHITSQGRSTTDYVCTTVNVRDRGLTLGDLPASGGLTYDYFEGSENTNAAPDEVFLMLRGSDGSLSVTYQNLDRGDAGQWYTRDVSAQLESGGWRSMAVDSDEVDVESELVTTTNRAIVETATSLRDSEPFTNVIDRLGSDAELLAVSIGNGWTTRETTVDAYYDSLVVDGQTYAIPAVVVLDGTVDTSGDATSITLRFDDGGDQVGFSLADVDPRTVAISRYAPIAPPVAGTSTRSQGVNVRTLSGNAVEVEVPSDVVDELSDGGQSTLLVFGEFAVERPLSFVATVDPDGTDG